MEDRDDSEEPEIRFPVGILPTAETIPLKRMSQTKEFVQATSFRKEGAQHVSDPGTTTIEEESERTASCDGPDDACTSASKSEKERGEEPILSPMRRTSSGQTMSSNPLAMTLPPPPLLLDSGRLVHQGMAPASPEVPQVARANIQLPQRLLSRSVDEPMPCTPRSQRSYSSNLEEIKESSREGSAAASSDQSSRRQTGPDGQDPDFVTFEGNRDPRPTMESELQGPSKADFEEEHEGGSESGDQTDTSHARSVLLDVKGVEASGRSERHVSEEEVNSYREKVQSIVNRRVSRSLSFALPSFNLRHRKTHSIDNITFEQFKEVLSCKSDVLPKRIYKVLSKSGTKVTKEALVDAMVQSDCGGFGDKLRFTFDVYDIDGSGEICKDDLMESLKGCMQENNLPHNEEILNEIADEVMRCLDKTEKGNISFNDFKACVLSHSKVAQSFKGGFPGLLPYKQGNEEKREASALMTAVRPYLTAARKRYIKNRDYFMNNKQKLAILFLTVAFCVGCFYWRYAMWAHTPKQRLMSWSLPIAKGCGQAMKVTFSLILIPVSRNAVTWARNTYLGSIIPFDEAISYHKFLGRLGFFFATVHTLCHVADFYNAGDPARAKLWALAFPDSPDQPPPIVLWTSQVAVTGMSIYLIMCIAYAFALDFPRRSKWVINTRLGRVLNNFNYFWYTHHLFALFYVLLFFHPMPGIPDERNEWGVSDYWAWGGVPILIYLLERIVRLYRQKSWQTRVLRAEGLPGGVVALYISKPKGFRCKTGMYVFLNCPQISSFEWHPYTMTSAPGDDHIRCHVASLGDWSSAVHELFTNREIEATEALTLLRPKSVDRSELFTTENSSAKFMPSGGALEHTGRFDSIFSAGMSDYSVTIPRPSDGLKVCVDGPYGAPAQDYEHYSVLLCVGAGIGVTPFASMLKNLMNQFEDHRCQHCGKVNLNPSFKLRKVYFFWVVRNPRSAMWFNRELQAIKEDDHNNMLDINIHVTGVQKPEDVRSKLLQLAQMVYHKERGIDIITGAPAISLTNFGRPVWPEVFNKIKSKHPRSTVGVFFCGQPVLGKLLGKLCRQLSEKRGTKFEFSFERF